MFTRGKAASFFLALGVLTIVLGTSAELDAAAPLIKAAQGLFDQSQTDSLGLAPVKGEHRELYRATKDGYKFCQRADGTYPTNTVLADGTLLSVCSANHGNRAIAIRWRLPDKDSCSEGND